MLCIGRELWPLTAGRRVWARRGVVTLTWAAGVTERGYACAVRCRSAGLVYNGRTAVTWGQSGDLVTGCPHLSLNE